MYLPCKHQNYIKLHGFRHFLAKVVSTLKVISHFIYCCACIDNWLAFGISNITRDIFVRSRILVLKGKFTKLIFHIHRNPIIRIISSQFINILGLWSLQPREASLLDPPSLWIANQLRSWKTWRTWESLLHGFQLLCNYINIINYIRIWNFIVFHVSWKRWDWEI